MDDSKDIELTELTNTDIIEKWDRRRYPSFQDYLNSPEFEKLKVEYEI